jgi:phospholipase/carboxylesterase
MRREEMAGLEVVLTGGVDREGGGDGPLVVLLHGFGAPGEDLVPLWRVLDVPQATRFAFPAAPLELDAAFGGRAWWMIDMMELQAAMMRGEMRELTAEVPAGLPEASAQVSSLLDELESKLAPPRLVLGGFSQGAMLATDVALRRTKKPLAGLVLLSGTLIAAHLWAPLLPAQKLLPVFQSHGAADPILPFDNAERLHQLFSGAGLAVEWVPFRGQHEIPQAVLARLGVFLKRALG